ncbi:methyltransferase family protein [Kitasatospora sp. KL5]|uniref:methyltransferase family protein n=1 Tax=Kitasatospora sp. KL5 TaxID=3425125 RepID=UPI003D701EA8
MPDDPLTTPGTGRRRAIGPALFGLGLVVNAAGLVVNLRRDDQPLRWYAVAFVVANLLWLIHEMPVTLGKPDTPPHEVATLVVYGCTRFATVAASVLAPIAWDRALPWLPVAAALYAGGIGLRLLAIRTLGRFYSHYVIRRDDESIVRTGPYRLIRHPAYAGMLTAHVGLVLFFLNWIAVLLLAALAAVLAWRIRVEERALLTIPAYRDYAVGHARLVPGLW